VHKSLSAGLVLGFVLATAAYGDVHWHTSEIDLGSVYRDEPQKMSFGFVNTSDDTVFIYDIEPSCDCTSAQAIPPAVPPHNTGEILAFFDPMGYEGKGRVTEYIRLATSDPLSPEVELYFSIEVGIGPEPEPRALNFGTVCEGESDTLGLVVNPASDRELDILDIESETDCVWVNRVGAPRSAAHEFIVIVCNLDCRGAVSSYINIKTTDPTRETIRVPVTANLAGSIVIEPEVIAFGATLPGKQVAQSARIYCTQGSKFMVSKVTCTANPVECSVALAEGNVYELTMEIKEDAPAGRVAGEIIIETDCESQPVLTAKVTGYVRSVGK
jgi:hypothetical protein